MSDFEEHQHDAIRRFPVTSVFVLVALYAVTKDSLLVLVTLGCGSLVIRAGSAVPDVDSNSSKPRRAFGRLLTWGIGSITVLSAIHALGSRPTLTGVFRELPTVTVASGLLVFLLVWVGMGSRHRSVTHSVLWGVGLAVSIGVFGFSLFRPAGLTPAFGFGSALATYSFAGVYSHMALDDERKLGWDGKGRSRTHYRRYLDRTAELYVRTSVVVVAIGLVVFDAGALLLVLLAGGYLALLAGLTLPEIDRKPATPRLVFDQLVCGLLAGLLLHQALVAGRLSGVDGLSLPTGTIPAVLFALFVLWLGRDADPDSRTHTLAWPGAVTASLALVVYRATAGLPTDASVALAVGFAAYLLAGFRHHLRVEGVVGGRGDGGEGS